MLKSCSIILSLLLILSASVSAETPQITPGVSKTLAVWRAAHYSDVRYKLDLKLEKMSPVLKGTIEVRLRVRESGKEGIPIILDWRKIAGHEKKSRVFDVSLNGKSVAPEELNQHLIFRDGVKEGENVVKLSFESPILKSGSAITRYIDSVDGSEYIYSLFVPSDASTAFPVFDQPDLKAKFTLSAVRSSEWIAVSNAGPCGGRMDGTGIVQNDFCATEPISTYVFAFAAGPFVKFNELGESWPVSNTLRSGGPQKPQPPSNPPINVYLRRSQAEKFKPHAKEFFRLNREAIKYFEKYFDYKFPFPKYDIVLIPEFPFGGMEHAGATFLRERSVIFPTEPTANNYIARASVIFHEAAHQWFGDTVTMEWFDDLWLKEGFATFMANKAMTEVLPQYDSWKVFYQRTKPGAYATDVTKGTTPIYQDIPNLNSAKSAYGNIVYQKAPSFLKQAEFYLGEKDFQNAVQLFLRHHAYSNADWSMLVKAFEATGKKDLTKWADAWVKTRGVPIVRLKRSSYHSYKEMGQPHDTADIYTLVQDDALGEGGKWPLKTKVLLRFKNGTQEIKEVDLFSQSPKTGFGKYWVDIQGNPNFKSQAPVFVFPNFEDKAYGIFLLDPRSRRYALENIRNEKDEFLRSMMWGALWDSVRFGELDPAKYIELAIKNISVEKDVTTISSILGRVRTAHTYYLNNKQKSDFGPKLEKLLMGKMNSAKTNGELLTYYRSYLAVAESPESGDFLESLVLKSKTGRGAIVIGKTAERLSGLLRSRDFFSIAGRLIARGDKRGSELLVSLEKTEKDDASKRYAYSAKAGFATAENKKKYFDDFINNKAISESWIEAAFGAWNSPAQDDLTLPYLERALAELPNLKRDRKIFFVNGWLGAFIGGQKSQQALDIVNKFLKDNPGLDADLRRKILERMDGLERAVKIRSKYK
jgi:aminopeptidase N